jgi:aminobenzoyl-glutamate transport protein
MKAAWTMAPGDVVFAEIATQAAQVVDPDAVVRATDNSYFTTVSALLLAVVLTIVTEKVLARREGELVPDVGATGPTMAPRQTLPDAVEARALRVTGLVAATYVLLLGVGMIPSGSPLRGADGAVLDSTLFNSIPVFISLFFFLVGACFAKLTVHPDRRLPAGLHEERRHRHPRVVHPARGSRDVRGLDRALRALVRPRDPARPGRARAVRRGAFVGWDPRR